VGEWGYTEFNVIVDMTYFVGTTISALRFWFPTSSWSAEQQKSGCGTNSSWSFENTLTRIVPKLVAVAG
jgi:hypothetical protein